MPNPILDGFVRVLGDLKLFPWPLFLLYDPGSYRVKGKDMRAAMAAVRPGDLLVRGYVNYLDGYLIPGYFSHIGLYLGPVAEAERAACRADAGERFQAGEQMVVHALAEGVLLEDLLNFCRCDFLAILRFPARLEARQADFVPAAALDAEEARLHGELVAGRGAPFTEVFPVMRRVALSQVGVPYDMGFNFTDFTRFSCTELIYFATKAVHAFLRVAPERRRVAFLFRNLIEPDAFVRSPLELVWASPSTSPGKLARLRPPRPPALP